MKRRWKSWWWKRAFIGAYLALALAPAASAKAPTFVLGKPDWSGYRTVNDRRYLCELWLFTGSAFVQACYPSPKKGKA